MSDDECSYDSSSEYFDDIYIFEAIKADNVPLLQKLTVDYKIDDMYDIHNLNDDGILYYALYHKSRKILKYLLGFMNIDHPIDIYGRNLLKEIVINMHPLREYHMSKSKLKYVLRHTKNINLTDNDGNTALMLSIIDTRHYTKTVRKNIIVLLLENGADPLIKNKSGCDAIYSSSDILPRLKSRGSRIRFSLTSIINL